MADRVLVRQVVTTVETRAGTEAWVDDSSHVQGMVAGGYWEVVDRRAGRKGKAVEGGDDPSGPAQGDG